MNEAVKLAVAARASELMALEFRHRANPYAIFPERTHRERLERALNERDRIEYLKALKKEGLR